MKYVQNPIHELQPGTEITISGFVVLSQHGFIMFNTGEFPDYITIAPYEVKVTVPADFNPMLKAVEGIDKQLDQLADRYHTEVARLRDKKEQMLQLGMNAGKVVDMNKGDPE